ncbi:MAG TPA: TfoX/Sxy family protein [Vicinamibacteria bacterium]|nr:TfoX/Sxy family protein [Vicinamibacteria bacterium]
MPYDQTLAERIRHLLRRRRRVEERRMFGGVAFLVNGHMSVGVVGDNLVLRLGNERTAEALQKRHTLPMDFTGKPLRSLIYVEPAGYRKDGDLADWVGQAIAYAKSQPPKSR